MRTNDAPASDGKTTPKERSWGWVIVATVAGLVLSACASGPPYLPPPEAGSAGIEGAVKPFQGGEYGSCSIDIWQIDGGRLEYTASALGWTSLIIGIDKPLRVSAGHHSVVLGVSDTYDISGNVGHGKIGVVSTYSFTSEQPYAMEFIANHLYRIGANHEGDFVVVYLWDVTDGPASRKVVSSWKLQDDGTFYQAPAGINAR